ncbi:MAG: phenylacetate--CoA ligase family protein, partial [Candidatus Binatota bacterium]
MSRKALEEHQVKRLREMLQPVLETNEFYRKKLLKNGALKINSLEQLKELPFTTKSELVQDQLDHPPFGTDLTYPLERYIRVHQTSGT